MFGLLARFLKTSAKAEPGTAAGQVDASGPESWKAKGNGLFVAGRMEEALACYRKALEIDPDYGDARWNAALAALFLGDYTAGFSYYESRFHAGPAAHRQHLQDVTAMMAGKRFWRGEALRGERLLVWTEQGFGDSLMFMRFLPQLRERGRCRLLVACEQEMVRVMERMPGVDEVISKDLALSPDCFDLHCSLLSLPHLLGLAPAALSAARYMTVPEDMARHWAARLAGLPNPKVGVAWAGGAQLPEDSVRSLALKEFRPLAETSGVTFVSLQKGAPAAQLAELDWPIVDWMGECRDFLDTAALVQGLDLVVSADTAVAHLAGALGKPVWLLNRHESEWRWMLGREDSLWYPTMRIFRQPAPRDWAAVMLRVAEELRKLAAAWSRSGRSQPL
ncbi:MAG: tetratricopeptide repeat protein [Ignavibacteria bacterium]